MFAAVAANAAAMDEAEKNTSPPTLTPTDDNVAKDSALIDGPIDIDDDEENDNFDPNKSMRRRIRRVRRRRLFNYAAWVMKNQKKELLRKMK